MDLSFASSDLEDISNGPDFKHVSHTYLRTQEDL